MNTQVHPFTEYLFIHKAFCIKKKHLNNYKMVGSARFLNVYKNWVPDPGEDTSFINFTLKRGQNVHYKYMYWYISNEKNL